VPADVDAPPDFDAAPPPGVIVPPSPAPSPTSPGVGAGGLLLALLAGFGLWRLAKGAA
jgi:hypothetical protein